MLPIFLALFFSPLISGTPFAYDDFELNQPFDVEIPDTNFVPTPTTEELIENAGYNGETHHVVTQDNYVLGVHRITGRKGEASNVKKPVVFLMHGLVVSSASWVLSVPEKSLGFILADQGYDVWMGNARGNFYSRKHLNYTIEDKEFWMYSWHEIGIRDLPAMIDYVLEKTGNEKLFYMGHSQGTTSFFVMASELPQYQSKIEAMFALAPVAYCSRMFSPPFQVLARLTSSMTAFFDLFGKHDLKPTSEGMKKLKAVACNEDAITQPLCSNVLFLITGYNTAQLNKTLVPTILQHVPAGASTRQFVHYAQLIKSGKFRQYDHGLIGNMKRYGQIRPPAYNLKNIKIPVHLHYSTNDWLSHVRDVHQLYNELGNPTVKLRVPDEKFNHLDYVWGIDAPTLLYDKILSFLSRYRRKD